MKRLITACVVVGLLLAFNSSSWANITLLTDNFDSENGGVEKLNYNSFTNWDVSDGTVDLIGNGGTYDFLPGNGLYVDMDGSSGDAGKITTKTVFNLIPGQYILMFDLAGNQRNTSPETVTVQVALGNLLDQTLSLDRDDPFISFSIMFTVTPATATTGTLSFEGGGGDNIGMLLDNVQLSMTPVPAPGAILLGSIGVGLVGWLKRRKTL